MVSLSDEEVAKYEEDSRTPQPNLIRRRLVRTFIVLLLMVVLIWVILRPSKPKFIIQDATIFLFNVSATNSLSSSIQVTISARNPNDKIGIYYDRLDVSAVYRNQQINVPTSIRPTFQGPDDLNIWSSLLAGNDVPISPYIGAALKQDQLVGSVFLSIKIDGRIRFKVKTFTSGGYHLSIDCPAFIAFKNPTASIVVSNNVVKYQLVRPCSVTVG